MFRAISYLLLGAATTQALVHGAYIAAACDAGAIICIFTDFILIGSRIRGADRK